MLKKLLPGLSMVALLFTACKKQDVSDTVKTTRTIVENPVEPTPMLAPKLFFIDRSQYVINTAILHRLTNILDAKPAEEKAILNVGANNALGNFIWGKPWAYNSKTNEITTLGSLISLDKLSTFNYKYTSISTQFKNCRSHIRIDPDNTQFYCIGGDNNGSIMKGNIADCGNVQTIFSEDGSTRITALDVDYKNKFIYFADAIAQCIYKTDLGGKNKTIVAALPLGLSIESSASPILRIDQSKNKLFLSTRSQSAMLPKKIVLLTFNISLIKWENILEIPDEVGSAFSFDILAGSKVFYSYYKPSTKTSVVNRMNLDGTDIVKLYSGFDVRNVVVAMVDGNN
jgi:hypothetical protein